MAADECKYVDEHPRLDASLEELERQVEEIARRVNGMEREMRDANASRVTDLKDFTDKLGEVHEKVNGVALKLAGLDGRIIGAVLAGSAAASVIGFMLSHYMRG